LTVPVGATVTWVNQDDDAHTVTADDGRFTSAGLDHGEQFSYRFAAPGTYAYHCALHPHMTARIVVQ
jgi:plastocyanin